MDSITYLDIDGLKKYDKKIKEYTNEYTNTKADSLSYNSETSMLELKSGETVLSSVEISGGSGGDSKKKKNKWNSRTRRYSYL